MTLDTTKLYYLSHPFSSFGDREENHRDAAEIAEKLWLKYGIAVVNPLSIKMPDDPKTAMRQCLWLLHVCETIIMCEDWEKAEGCKDELDYSKNMGKEILFIENLL